MDLRQIRDAYIDDGLDFQNATARTCRDVVLSDAGDMRENNPQDAYARLSRVLNDRRFRKNLANARNNWLGANVDKVVSGILRHFEA